MSTPGQDPAPAAGAPTTSAAPSGMPPVVIGLVLLVAFCGGIQLAFLIQMLQGVGYFGGGAVTLAVKFATLALLLAGIYLLLPRQRQELLKARASAAASRAQTAVAKARSNLPVVQDKARQMAAAAKSKRAARNEKPAAAPAATAAVAPRPPVKVNVETPLQRGPVWPPGEPIPITIQIRVEGPGAPEDVDVQLTLQHAGGTEHSRVPLRGNAAVLTQTVPTAGPFVLTATALRGGMTVAESSVRGVAASYREEIGRRFEALKTAAAGAGMAVGPDSTPREVRDALARRYPALRPSLQDLVAAIEVALYSQEDIGRDTYEGLVRALAELERRGLEAAPRA